MLRDAGSDSLRSARHHRYFARQFLCTHIRSFPFVFVLELTSGLGLRSVVNAYARGVPRCISGGLRKECADSLANLSGSRLGQSGNDATHVR
jgi:hypothetical protein